MKKILTLTSIAAIIAVSTGISANAVVQTQDRGYISINASENKELSPDTAEISFAVKTSDNKSMQKATIQNKEISDKLYTMLNTMINKDKGDYIKTADYSAQPVYTYSGNKKNLDRYEVSNKVIVHTKSIDKIGTMIDKSIETGATNVNSLNFSLSKYDEQCNELLGKASQKAQSRAAYIAKNLGTTLDGIRSVDISCSANNSSNPRMYLAKNMLGAVADSAGEESASTSISSGVVKINANVNVTFFVK